MHRAPVRPQRSSAAPRPPGRFPSPGSCWGFPGSRSPYGGSPRGCPPYSPSSPLCSPGFSPGFSRGFGGGDRGYGGQMRRSGDGFRWSGSPASSPRSQVKPRSSDSVEKYFSPSMLQDPWATLQPQPGKQQQQTAGRTS